MKIVVVGLGKVGRALTQQLSADKHDIVVIDRNPTVVDDICNICDVRGVTGNGGCYEVQAEAFEGGADLLIAATDSDEINILACLVAKKLNTRHTIARIRNPEYEKQLRFMRQELGLSMVINPEKATAREIARVLRFPNALKLEQFSKQRFELVEYRLTEGNPLTGLQLSDLIQQHAGQNADPAPWHAGKQITIPTGRFYPGRRGYNLPDGHPAGTGTVLPPPGYFQGARQQCHGGGRFPHGVLSRQRTERDEHARYRN